MRLVLLVQLATTALVSCHIFALARNVQALVHVKATQRRPRRHHERTFMIDHGAVGEGLPLAKKPRFVQIDQGVKHLKEPLPSALCFPKGTRSLGCAPLLESPESPREMGSSPLPCVDSGTCPFVKFRCSKGHTWKAVTGSPVCFFCPICQGSTKVSGLRAGEGGVRGRPVGTGRVGLDDVRAAARRRGGDVISDAYDGLRHHVRLRCSDGHEWEATPAGVLYTSAWCPKCAANKTSQRMRLKVEDMHETARMCGGEFLEQEYMGSRVKHLWRCSEGHEFMQSPQNIRRRSDGARKPSFCPICARVKAQKAAAAASATTTSAAAAPTSGAGGLSQGVASSAAIRSSVQSFDQRLERLSVAEGALAAAAAAVARKGGFAEHQARPHANVRGKPAPVERKLPPQR